MKISVQFDVNKNEGEDVLLNILKLLGKENIEVKKSISVSEARSSLRKLAKLGRMDLAQQLVNKYCGGSVEGAPEDSYMRLVSEIDNIIGEGV